MDCIQFLLPLRGKYRTEWPFRWQETQDGGGAIRGRIFILQRKIPTLRRPWFCFISPWQFRLACEHCLCGGQCNHCLEQGLKLLVFLVEFCHKGKKKVM